MQSVRLFVSFLLLLALLFPGKPNISQALAACGGAACIFLPLVEAPTPIQVYELEFTRTRSGGCRIVGDVVNISKTPIVNVTLEVRQYDTWTYELVEVVTDTAILPYTLPGQLNPFDIYGGCSSDCISDHYRQEIEIVGWEAASDPGFLLLTTVSIEYNNSVTPTGATVEIRNDSPYTLTNIVGSVWTTSLTSPFGLWPVHDLAPGETEEFTIDEIYGIGWNVHASFYGVPVKE